MVDRTRAALSKGEVYRKNGEIKMVKKGTGARTDDVLVNTSPDFAVLGNNIDPETGMKFKELGQMLYKKYGNKKYQPGDQVSMQAQELNNQALNQEMEQLLQRQEIVNNMTGRGGEKTKAAGATTFKEAWGGYVPRYDDGGESGIKKGFDWVKDSALPIFGGLGALAAIPATGLAINKLGVSRANQAEIAEAAAQYQQHPGLIGLQNPAEFTETPGFYIRRNSVLGRLSDRLGINGGRGSRLSRYMAGQGDTYGHLTPQQVQEMLTATHQNAVDMVDRTALSAATQQAGIYATPEGANVPEIPQVSNTPLYRTYAETGVGPSDEFMTGQGPAEGEPKGDAYNRKTFKRAKTNAQRELLPQEVAVLGGGLPYLGGTPNALRPEPPARNLPANWRQDRINYETREQRRAREAARAHSATAYGGRVPRYSNGVERTDDFAYQGDGNGGDPIYSGNDNFSFYNRADGGFVPRYDDGSDSGAKIGLGIAGGVLGAGALAAGTGYLLDKGGLSYSRGGLTSIPDYSQEATHTPGVGGVITTTRPSLRATPGFFFREGSFLGPSYRTMATRTQGYFNRQNLSNSPINLPLLSHVQQNQYSFTPADLRRLAVERDWNLQEGRAADTDRYFADQHHPDRPVFGGPRGDSSHIPPGTANGSDRRGRHVPRLSPPDGRRATPGAIPDWNTQYFRDIPGTPARELMDNTLFGEGQATQNTPNIFENRQNPFSTGPTQRRENILDETNQPVQQQAHPTTSLSPIYAANNEDISSEPQNQIGPNFIRINHGLGYNGLSDSGTPSPDQVNYNYTNGPDGSNRIRSFNAQGHRKVRVKHHEDGGYVPRYSKGGQAAKYASIGGAAGAGIGALGAGLYMKRRAIMEAMADPDPQVAFQGYVEAQKLPGFLRPDNVPTRQLIEPINVPNAPTVDMMYVSPNAPSVPNANLNGVASNPLAYGGQIQRYDDGGTVPAYGLGFLGDMYQGWNEGSADQEYGQSMMNGDMDEDATEDYSNINPHHIAAQRAMMEQMAGTQRANLQQVQGIQMAQKNANADLALQYMMRNNPSINPYKQDLLRARTAMLRNAEMVQGGGGAAARMAAQAQYGDSLMKARDQVAQQQMAQNQAIAQMMSNQGAASVSERARVSQANASERQRVEAANTSEKSRVGAANATEKSRVSASNAAALRHQADQQQVADTYNAADDDRIDQLKRQVKEAAKEAKQRNKERKFTGKRTMRYGKAKKWGSLIRGIGGAVDLIGGGIDGYLDHTKLEEEKKKSRTGGSTDPNDNEESYLRYLLRNYRK